ncbi:hypothetical protein D3C87_55010 [compost metagenome]
MPDIAQINVGFLSEYSQKDCLMRRADHLDLVSDLKELSLMVDRERAATGIS